MGIIINLILGIGCVLGGIFAGNSIFYIAGWVCLGILVIWSIVDAAIAGDGLIGILIKSTFISTLIPFAIVAAITYFAFGFLDARTFFYTGAVIALVNILPI